MIEGMYAAASGMAAQQQRLDAVANDLANTSTTGYKHNRIAFRDLLYQRQTHGTQPQVAIGTGSAATTLGRATAQGALKQTNRPLDVALHGPGYLQVRLADGRVGLTRDGNLQIDARGRLALHSGQLVSPEITLPKDATEQDLTIRRDGTVVAAGREVGRLRIVEVRSPSQLDPAAANTFTVSEGSGPIRQATQTNVVGGSLEESNTDTATAMSAMIESQRSLQLASRAITTQNEVWEIANQVKR